MMWQQARKDAELRLRAFLQAAQERGIDPREMEVALGLYADQDTLDLLQPDNKWPVAYHQQVARATMRILRAKKFQVSLVPITLVDYQQWLGERENTPDRRAQFLAERLKS